MAKVTFEKGDVLALRVERQPVYADSARHATYRESKLTLQVYSQFDDGRYSLQAMRPTVRTGHGMMKRFYVLSADLERLNSKMGTGRPMRYDVLEVTLKPPRKSRARMVVEYDPEWDQWAVVVYDDKGKRDEDATYYASDEDDAVATREAMLRQSRRR